MWLPVRQQLYYRHIYQIRRFRQLLWGQQGPLYRFVLCLVGDCGKIVIFAIFAKFANIISFLQFLLLCAFLDMSPF